MNLLPSLDDLARERAASDALLAQRERERMQRYHDVARRAEEARRKRLRIRSLN